MKPLVWVSVLLSFITFLHAVPPTVLSTTGTIVSMRVDADNGLDVLVLETLFDQEIYVTGSNGSQRIIDFPILPVQTTSQQLCLPPFPCSSVAPIIEAQFGLSSFECTGSFPISFSSLPSDSLEFLIPTAPVDPDPLLSLLVSMEIIEPLAYNNLNSNKISAVVVLSFISSGTRIVHPVVGDLQLLNDALSNGECTLTFDSSLTNAAGEGVITAQSTAIGIQNHPCSYFELIEISTRLQNVIEATSHAQDWDQLLLVLWESTLLGSGSVPMRACREFIEEKLQTEITNTTILDSIDCPFTFGSSEWKSDPCCNGALRWTMCCAPRAITVSRQDLIGVQASSVTTCKQPLKVVGALQDYVNAVANGEDPVTGCTATARKIASSALFDELRAFIDVCFVKLYGIDFSGVLCERDADCLGNLTCDILTRKCRVPPTDLAEAVLFDCYNQEMSPELKSFLLLHWGLNMDASTEEFKHAFFNNLNDLNCVGATAFDYNWGPDPKGGSALVYRRASIAACLSDETCAHDASLNRAQCLETEGNYSCVDCGSRTCSPRSYLAECFVQPNPSIPEQCNALGATWDESRHPYSCHFPDRNTQESCLNMTVCPLEAAEPGHYIQWGCYFSFCYNPDLNETQCLLNEFTWDQELASGMGLCRRIISRSGCQDLGGGWQWWQAVGWFDDLYTTQETCERGLCSTGDRIIIGSSADHCDEQKEYCSTTCAMCISEWGVDELCFVTNATDELSCTTAGGLWNADWGVCLYSTDEEVCAASNNTWVSCRRLTKSQCDECLDGSCSVTLDYLGCVWAWSTRCEDEEECNAAGNCGDSSFYNWNDVALGYCNYWDLFQPNWCIGSCARPLDIDANGNPSCAPRELQTPTHCIYRRGQETPELCNQRGPPWEWRPLAMRSESECLSLGGYGCLMPGKRLPTALNETECTACGNDVVANYQWRSATWSVPRPKPLIWRKHEWLQLNRWDYTLNYTKLYQVIDQVITQRFAAAIQTEAKCRYNPLIDALHAVACDCGFHPPSIDCFPENIVRSIDVGVVQFCAGLPSIVQAGSVQLSIGQQTVPVALHCLDIEIHVVPASQFKRNTDGDGGQLSSNLFDSGGGGGGNPYSVVVNEHGATVGQLIGDGAVIVFRGYSGSMAEVMVLCIERRRDIHQESGYDDLDFATADSSFKQWTPMETTVNLNVIDALSDTTYYCIETGEQGRYFPIRRYSDWRDRTPDDDDSLDVPESVFIYFLAALYFIIAFAAIVSLILAFVFAPKSLTIQKAMLTMLILFALIRGTHLSLVPDGTINDVPIAVYYILAELPVYIFFSLFSLLIFFWAELYHFATSRTTVFLNRMRIPFAVTNGIMYFLFVVVIVIFEAVDDEDAEEPIIAVYRAIIILIALIIMIGFWVYGGRLIWMQIKVRKVKKSKQVNRTFYRVTAVVAACTFGLFFMCVILIALSAAGSIHVGVAIPYYFFVEIVPAAMLLFILYRPPRHSSRASSVTTKSSTRKSDGGSGWSDRGNTLNTLDMDVNPSGAPTMDSLMEEPMEENPSTAGTDTKATSSGWLRGDVS